MQYFLLHLAQSLSTGTDSTSTETVNVPTMDANQLLANGLNLTYFLAGAIAVIVIIIGGILYAASSGDTGRITKAKNLIVYAVVGLVVVLVAFIITNFVIGRFN